MTTYVTYVYSSLVNMHIMYTLDFCIVILFVPSAPSHVHHIVLYVVPSRWSILSVCAPQINATLPTDGGGRSYVEQKTARDIPQSCREQMFCTALSRSTASSDASSLPASDPDCDCHLELVTAWCRWARGGGLPVCQSSPWRRRKQISPTARAHIFTSCFTPPRRSRRPPTSANRRVKPSGLDEHGHALPSLAVLGLLKTVRVQQRRQALRRM